MKADGHIAITYVGENTINGLGGAKDPMIIIVITGRCDRTGVPETGGAEGSGVWFQIAGPVDVGAKARVIRIVLLVARSPPPIRDATQDVQLRDAVGPDVVGASLLCHRSVNRKEKRVGKIIEYAIHIRFMFIIIKYIIQGDFSSSKSWRYMTYGEAVGAGSI